MSEDHSVETAPTLLASAADPAGAESPAVEAPDVEVPDVEVPAAEAPAAEAPALEVPAAEAPTAEAPALEVPAAEAPTAEVPDVEVPDVEARRSEDRNVAAIASESSQTKPAKPAELQFSDLPLAKDVQRAVREAGYSIPTPIQAEIIPHMIAGRDLLAQSQTGTGKTAAFALPILTGIDPNAQSPQVLVLAPTRELAIQVANSFSTYGTHTRGLKVATIYGGQDYEPQLRQLRRGAQVVVGTPGRVIDHIKRGSLDLCSINCLILDEADEMLNMGFLEDVQFVLEQAPDDRQIALFSATLPEPIRKIAHRYLNDPVKIAIKKKTMTADSIRQRALFVSPREKIEVLKRFLEAEETDGVIVFTKTKDATVTVAEKLARDGLSVTALNGDMPQKVRERTIEQLKSGRLDILVATDVAARGLDVSRVSHVFNFDLPHDSESYIHRVGRTGRAGRKGEAIIFLTHAQRYKLRSIERVTKQTIEVVQPPTADDINANRIAKFKQSITKVTAARDLTMFKDLIAEYQAETGKPIELIAAALAHIAQQGRPFLIKDLPPAAKARGDRRQDRGADRRPQRHERDGAERRGAGGYSRQLGPPAAGMERYRIEVGRQHGVKPGNIVGAVANEAGIDGEFIGPIKIHDAFSTVDLPSGMPPDLVQSLSNTRVVGKKLLIKADTETDRRPSRRRDRDNDKSRKPSRGKKHKHAVARGKTARIGKGGKRKQRKTK